MLQALGANRIHSYHPLLEIQTHNLLQGILNSPDQSQSIIRRCAFSSGPPRIACHRGLRTHLRGRYTGGMTLLIVYGYRVLSNTDRFLEMADESLELLSNRIAAAGIVWMVDLFPPRTSLALVCASHRTDIACNTLFVAAFTWACVDDYSEAPPLVAPWRAVQARRSGLEGQDGSVCQRAVRLHQATDGASSWYTV